MIQISFINGKLLKHFPQFGKIRSGEFPLPHEKSDQLCGTVVKCLCGQIGGGLPLLVIFCELRRIQVGSPFPFAGNHTLRYKSCQQGFCSTYIPGSMC